MKKLSKSDLKKVVGGFGPGGCNCGISSNDTGRKKRR